MSSPSSSAACTARWTLDPYAITVSSPPSRAIRASPSGTACSPSGHLALDVAVEPLVLQVADRVRVPDRADQQALGVGGGRRSHDLQPRRLQEPGLGVLRVEGTAGEAAAGRQPDHHRHRDALAVVQLGRDVDELVEPAGDEVGELHLADGLRPSTAAPTAVPMIAFSASGVSRQRSAPNSSTNPSVTLNAPPNAPMSSPMQNTDWSRAHLLAERVGDRLRDRSSRVGRGARGGASRHSPFDRRPAPLPRRPASATTVRCRRRAARSLGEHARGGQLGIRHRRGERLARRIHPRRRGPRSGCGRPPPGEKP